MAKCYLSGVEIEVGRAYVLDVGPAKRVLRELRQRAAVLERLINDLGAEDKVEVLDPRTRKKRSIRQRRLLSQTIAEALNTAWPEAPLLITFSEWRARRGRHRKSGVPGTSGDPSLQPLPTEEQSAAVAPLSRNRAVAGEGHGGAGEGHGGAGEGHGGAGEA